MSSRNYPWLKNCPKSFKPVYYKWSINDIFVLLKKPVWRYVYYMKKNTKILRFRLKLKKITPFHCREKDKFTSVFITDTFSGVYHNFSSFVALEHKFGLVYILLHKSFTIVSWYFHILSWNMFIAQNFLTNAEQNLLIYFSKNLFLPPFKIGT